MSQRTIATELLTELSEEQQEILTGGKFSFPKEFAGNFGLSDTSYLQEGSALNTISTSGPQGSAVGGYSISQLINTNGLNAIGLK